ncbi:MAG: hypothetical protein WD226_05055 [Planctomycetota bacterium]
MKFLAPALLSFLGLWQEPPAFEVEPQPAVWDELGVNYRLRWQLPFARPGRESDDLLPSLAALVAFRDEAATDPRLASFASLVDAVRKAGDGGKALLEQLLTDEGQLVRLVRPFVRELLDDRRLLRNDWNSEDSRSDDGIAELETAMLPGFRAEPWTKLGGTDQLHAAAILLFADRQAWLDVMHDYRGYLRRPDANFEKIGPRPGKYLCGEDPAGRPFAAVTSWFESDLPFPFSSYSASVHTLHHFDAELRFVTDFYGRSKDVHWMAGQDVHFPLLDAAGELVAIFIVRRYGFDLKGVPDQEDARRTALRSGLGNLKRDAERNFAASGRELRSTTGLPTFRVLGPKR